LANRAGDRNLFKLLCEQYGSERGLARLLLANIEFWAGRLDEFIRVDFSRVDRFVFVCLGNICRSPFGQFVAQKYPVSAAGFGLSANSGLPAFHLGVEIAKDFNIDMSDHVTTGFSDFSINKTDLLLVMEVRHARRLRRLIGSNPAQIALLGQWAIPRRLHIHDPHKHPGIYFKNCYKVIENATENLINEYLAQKSI